ncbi:protein unc-93 homolog A-like isoform X1 [Haliotis rubra]|uniref:protein unc-93 homolog A-like isoform X1 n=1 Tax=Haliotis rubra TaxID=36100 RepID=UPI001EE5D951|nr:protein unc-93 homolog A-like isoform X1 [Haliotis rubra]
MVAEQPCEVHSQSSHPGIGLLDNGKLLEDPPPDAGNVSQALLGTRMDVDNYPVTSIPCDQLTMYTSAQETVPSSATDNDYPIVSIACLTGNNNEGDDFVFTGDRICDYDSGNNFGQSTSELRSDSLSSCSDTYSNSDYTDSLCSTDSSKFLLPAKHKVKETSEHDSPTHEQSTSDQRRSLLNVSKISESEAVIDIPDCFENKNYINSVTSDVSCSQLLLNRTESMWSFAKEVDAPIIGRIEHPGYFSSQRELSSTSNLSFACQKALKYLQDERVASSLLLPGSYKDVSKLPPDEEKDPDDVVDHNIVPSGRHTRNLLALSICNTMVFIACGSLRNLQSSINHEGGVGITSLAVSCLGFMLGSIFSPFIVQNFDPYKSLLASLFPHVLFIAANFYPVMWLMGPISFLQGISTAIMWNAMSTYITFLAKGYSEKRKQDYESVLNRFFGIFCLLYQIYMVFGNLIASLVLTYANPVDVSNVTTSNESVIIPAQNLSDYMYSISSNPMVNSTSFGDIDSSSNFSICGSNYCHHYTISNSGTTVSDFAKYLLFGIYLGCMLLALLFVLFLLEPLNSRLFSTVMTCGMVKSQMVSLGKFIVNRKFVLLCPLLLFGAMEQGFATAEITKAFVTCPIGVHMVGYMMICMGVSASVSAYLSGWLCKYMGRIVLIAIAVVCNLALLTFMSLWSPTPDSLVILFVLFGFWGFADGIWLAQSQSLMGVLFPDEFENAFTGLRIMQGLGSTLTFAYAQSFCMASKIYIMGSVCIIGMACYMLSEHLLKKEQRRAKTVIIVSEVV